MWAHDGSKEYADWPVDDLVRSASEHVLVALGLTLYFREPLHTFRDAAGELLDAYLEHAEPHLHWYADNVTDRFKRAKPELLRVPKLLLADPAREEKFTAWIYLGGDDHDDLTPWYLRVRSYADEDRKDSLSFVSLTFPVDYWAANFGDFAKWVERVSASLPVFHGNAGFAFAQNKYGGIQQRNDRYVLPIAMRFHGVEVEDPTLSDRSCYKHIKGVNWLTLVSEPLLDDLGGIQMTTAALEQAGGITVHRMPWGLLIQAGDRPGVGDVNQDPKPLPLYRKVNKVLRRIRTSTHFGFGDTFEVPETLRWLRRFDDVGT